MEGGAKGFGCLPACGTADSAGAACWQDYSALVTLAVVGLAGCACCCFCFGTVLPFGVLVAVVAKIRKRRAARGHREPSGDPALRSPLVGWGSGTPLDDPAADDAQSRVSPTSSSAARRGGGAPRAVDVARPGSAAEGGGTGAMAPAGETAAAEQAVVGSLLDPSSVAALSAPLIQSTVVRAGEVVDAGRIQ